MDDGFLSGLQELAATQPMDHWLNMSIEDFEVYIPIAEEVGVRVEPGIVPPRFEKKETNMLRITGTFKQLEVFSERTGLEYAKVTYRK